MIEARETDIARRERVAEERRVSVIDEARREALSKVQSELEILSRERSSLLLEKQLFLDQQATHAALVEAAKGVREELRQVRDELAAREQDVYSLSRQKQRMEQQRAEEEDQIHKVSILLSNFY